MATLSYSFRTKANQQKVYDAVSTQDGFRSWWTRNSTLDPKVGGEAEFKFQQGPEMTFRFDELKPGRGVKLTCIGTNDKAGGPLSSWVRTVLELDITPRSHAP